MFLVMLRLVHKTFVKSVMFINLEILSTVMIVEIVSRIGTTMEMCLSTALVKETICIIFCL